MSERDSNPPELREKSEICEKVKFIQQHGTIEQDEVLVDFVQMLYKEVHAGNRKASVKKEGNVITLPSQLPDLDDPKLWNKPRIPAEAEPPPAAPVAAEPREEGAAAPSVRERQFPPPSRGFGVTMVAVFALSGFMLSAARVPPEPRKIYAHGYTKQSGAKVKGYFRRLPRRQEEDKGWRIF